jgi:hypothetical protein
MSDKTIENNLVYLIEKISIDGMEREIAAAVSYEQFGFTLDVDEAEKFCGEGKQYTRKHCWAISGEMPEYRYSQLKQLK